MKFGPFGATHPGPFPQGLHQNFGCVCRVLIPRAIAYESLEILALMVWEQWCYITDGRTYVRTDGRGISQYPRFFFEKRGDKNYIWDN